MRASLAWRITGTYLLLIIATLLGLALYLVSFTRSTYQRQLESQLEAEARLVAALAAVELAQGTAQDLPGLVSRAAESSGSNIALLSGEGAVIAESSANGPQPANQDVRPEVASALRGERGVTVHRSSDPVSPSETLHVAVPISLDGRVLGVAVAASSMEVIQSTVASLGRAVGAASLLAGLAALLLTIRLRKTTTDPIKRLTNLARSMATGDLDSRLRVTSRDEVGELGQAFNRMADRVQETFRAISAERNRLAAILETVADGLVITDPDGRVLLLNPGAERLLRVDARQAIGLPFIKIGRDHELAALLEQPERGSRLIELGLPRRHVRAVAAAIPNTGGQRLLLLQDITELRRLESVRRDFVANVSHELRTPIASIKAIVETLEAGALEDAPAARDFLSRMHGEVDELAALVKELLELSRIESGQAEVRPEPTDLAALIASTADRLAPLAQRSGIDLRVAPAPPLPHAQADASRVGQVLANLIHNAIKFTPPGGWVELRAEQLDDELAVIVADSGVGIPPDELDRIFERFFKTDRSRSSGGSGLGLAVAKHLVQAHGGRIWAESGQGGVPGATFTFTLPLAAEEAESELVGGVWRRF